MYDKDAKTALHEDRRGRSTSGDNMKHLGVAHFTYHLPKGAHDSFPSQKIDEIFMRFSPQHDR